MGRYWVNFRIHQDATYRDRYAKLVKAVGEHKGVVWSAGTSFFLIKTDKDMEETASSLVEGLSPVTDLLVIGDITKQRAAYFGKMDDLESFQKVFPFTKNVM